LSQTPQKLPPRSPAVAGLRVLIVDRTVDRSHALREALEAEGYVALTPPDRSSDLLRCVRELEPDVVIIDMDSPDRDMLEDSRRIFQEQPKPIVMFVDESDSDSIRQAVQAGVASYVVKGASPERVRPVLEVAIARFRAFQELKTELAQARNSLADRKLIERAKGILMERRGCSEDDAYRGLRQMAMSRNQRLVEVARNVIELSALI
jgi:two-component system, response regulator / RNA-binding antiterminator